MKLVIIFIIILKIIIIIREAVFWKLKKKKLKLLKNSYSKILNKNQIMCKLGKLEWNWNKKKLKS